MAVTGCQDEAARAARRVPNEWAVSAMARVTGLAATMMKRVSLLISSEMSLSITSSLYFSACGATATAAAYSTGRTVCGTVVVLACVGAAPRARCSVLPLIIMHRQHRQGGDVICPLRLARNRRPHTNGMQRLAACRLAMAAVSVSFCEAIMRHADAVSSVDSVLEDLMLGVPPA